MSGGPDLDLLLTHSAWVRALARRLVGEGADDLVQETWVAALARPEVELRTPRAWLAGVLRRLARQTRRGEARRRVREERSARDSRGASEPSVAETFEAAATGRALADLVLALDEPFRSVVLLRYYEDLPPRRIAEKLGIPVRTVNSRLERGLARLRERWQQRERDAGREGDAWAHALLLLAGRSSSLAPAAPLVGAGKAVAGTVVPLGVALMNAKIVLGVVLVGGGAVAWWLSSLAGKPGVGVAASEPAEVVRPAAELTPAPALVAPEVPVATRSASESRTALAPQTSASAAPAAPAPTLRTLRGRVLDPVARPLPGVEIAYRPNGGAKENHVARSGANGQFELQVPFGLGDLTATDPELVTVMRGRVTERTEVEPLIVVAPRLALAGHVQDELAAPLGEVRVSYRHPPGFRARFEAVLDATDFTEWSTLTREDGAFELANVPRIEGAELVAELEGFVPWSGALPWQDDRGLVLTLARKASEVAAVSGVVLDPDGHPVPGAWVSLGAKSTATDANGEFRLERTDALEATELRALKAGFRMARVAAAIGPDGKPVFPEFAEVTLGGAPLALVGRVVDSQGKPRADLQVWLADPTSFGVLMDDMNASAEFYLADAESHGDAYFSSRSTDDEGRFRIDGLLERDYSVRVMSLRTLSIATFGPFHAGERGVEITFDDGPLGRIEGRLVGRDGHALAGVSVGLMGNTYGGIWSGVGAGETRSDEEGRFSFADVGGEVLKLAVSGDDIVPIWSSVDAPHGKTVEVELVIGVRCHFQVDLGGDVERADQLRVLDGDGGALPAYRIDPTGTLTLDEFPIVAGRSDALGVDERATTLVLLKGGVEVLRVPLALRRGELVRITP